MTNEYFQLNHTGQQIDDAIDKIDGLEESINTNTKNIGTNTTDITTLKGSISNRDSQIQTNSDNITTCLTRITAIETSTVAGLQSQIKIHSENISDLRGLINNKVEQGIYDKAIEDLKSQDNQLQSNIEATKDSWDIQLNLVKNDIKSNKDNIDILFNRVNDINTSVGNIEGLQQSVNSLSQDFGEFRAGDFTNTQTAVNNALTAIGELRETHSNDIQGIQTTLAEIPNTYKTNEDFASFYNDTFEPLSEEVYKENGILDEIVSLKEQIKSLQQQIDELKSST